MDTWQILCTLRIVNTFFDVFPSELLPLSRLVQKPYTLIVNVDSHTEGGSHWLAMCLKPRSFSVYYFDSYGIVPHVRSIQVYLKHNCTIWEYNERQLLCMTSDVCGQYCCLLRPLHGQGIHSATTHHAVRRLYQCRLTGDADVRVRLSGHQAFGVNAAAAAYKRWVLSKIPSFLV